ncbi:MAG: AI-2E family transporter [Proteobacteria bacterium]|nr:AI-2E family transporter [Pseudomonadota bacterium]MBS0463335.1 AI-2E family transporter [Pseudomonadota bacterium]MBS0463844.1 AI-2E family transporter [Pseudomonadota bacterium]
MSEPAHAASPSAPSSSTTGSPPRPRSTRAQLVLATLAGVFAAWAASDVLIPLLLALFFALVGNPILRGMRRLFIPRFVGAALLLGAGLAGAAMLVDQLAAPATQWLHQAPAQLRQLEPRLRTWLRPVREASSAAQSIAQAATSGNARPSRVIRTDTSDPIDTLLATPRAAASVLAVILLTYFFMVYGQRLQAKAVALLPDPRRRRLGAEIARAIEREVSRYVATITLINVAVGGALAAILTFGLGVPPPQALLWGTLMALLNFAPYVGPMLGIAVMLLMGFTSYEDLPAALAPAAIYLGLHLLEGQLITPVVLGKRMAISPLLLILALLAFGWLWGIAGLLLAVPLLACVKIVLTRIDGGARWAALLE